MSHADSPPAPPAGGAPSGPRPEPPAPWPAFLAGVPAGTWLRVLRRRGDGVEGVSGRLVAMAPDTLVLQPADRHGTVSMTRADVLDVSAPERADGRDTQLLSVRNLLRGAVIFGGLGFILGTLGREVAGAAAVGTRALTGVGAACGGVVGLLAPRLARDPERAWSVARLTAGGLLLGVWAAGALQGAPPLWVAGLAGGALGLGTGLWWVPGADSGRGAPEPIAPGATDFSLSPALERQDRADDLEKARKRHARWRVRLAWATPLAALPLVLAPRIGLLVDLVAALFLVRIDRRLGREVEVRHRAWLEAYRRETPDPVASARRPTPPRTGVGPYAPLGAVLVGLPAMLWGSGEGTTGPHALAAVVYGALGAGVGALLGAALWMLEPPEATETPDAPAAPGAGLRPADVGAPEAVAPTPGASWSAMTRKGLRFSTWFFIVPAAAFILLHVAGSPLRGLALGLAVGAATGFLVFGGIGAADQTVRGARQRSAPSGPPAPGSSGPGVPAALRGLPGDTWVRIYHRKDGAPVAATGPFGGVEDGAVLLGDAAGGDPERIPLGAVLEVSVPSRPVRRTWEADPGPILWPLYATIGAVGCGIFAGAAPAVLMTDSGRPGSIALGMGLAFGAMAGSFVAGALDGRRRSALLAAVVVIVVGSVASPFLLIGVAILAEVLGVL